MADTERTKPKNKSQQLDNPNFLQAYICNKKINYPMQKFISVKSAEYKYIQLFCLKKYIAKRSEFNLTPFTKK